MCGFVAIYSKGKNHFQPTILEAMTDAITHRGPDDYGYAYIGPDQQFFWQERNPEPIYSSGIAMGHRRLSILDLSSAGRQPFTSKNKQYWMVYNGEVYNYLELRKELSSLGYTFTTSTDTEVVLVAYQHWGKDFLKRLNGMWALAIWDNKNKKLLISRDRFGVKPLFYCRIRDQWVFASEIKAILRHPAYKSKIRSESVFDFLWAGQHPESGYTYFEDIMSLPPASYMELSDGIAQVNKYWDLPQCDETSFGSLKDKSEHFMELLKDSIRLRLRSDVRVGTMLSGGLDSTSIVKIINDLLANHVEETSSIQGIQQAISACYPNLWNDETSRIEEIASKLNINLEKVYPAQEDIQGSFYKVIQGMDEPYNQSTPHVQYILMQKASSLGIKVTLNGHGPDEMYGGYPLRHCSLAAVQYLINMKFKSCLAEIAGMKKWHNIGTIEFLYALMYNIAPHVAEFTRKIYRFPKKRYFNGKAFKQYLSFSNRLRDSDTNGKTALDRRLKREFFSEVLPPILTYEDRMSMSASIESRVPFLDYRLVEFAFSLNDSDKIFRGITKYIMRVALKELLPKSIINEKMKLYFNGPYDVWLKKNLRQILDDTLMTGQSIISEFMNPNEYRSMIKRNLDQGFYDNWEISLIWRMLIAEAWMRTYRNSANEK